MVAVDIVGRLPQSTNGNLYLLVAEDCFTRWLEAWAISNQKAKTIVETLLNEIHLISFIPIMADSLRARSLKKLCKLLQINRSRTIPVSSPRGWVSGKGQQDCIKYVSYYVVKDHHDIHLTTGYSPFFLCLAGKLGFLHCVMGLEQDHQKE